MSTDIIIVSYKDDLELKRCIASIKKYCTDYKLIIENNNPPNINKGFTKSVNDGINKGSSEFIWLLNSDAIVKDSNTQQALLYQFLYHQKVGIVGSMQVDNVAVEQAEAGDSVGVKITERVRKGDVVYKIVD
jgi:GT2 family glycosyltransferase